MSREFAHVNAKRRSREPTWMVIRPFSFQEAVIGEKIQRESDFSGQRGKRASPVGAVRVFAECKDVLPCHSHFGARDGDAALLTRFKFFAQRVQIFDQVFNRDPRRQHIVRFAQILCAREAPRRDAQMDQPLHDAIGGGHS